MSTSTTGIWIICVVAVLGLITAVFVVRLAGRRPHAAKPQRGQMRGLVQGGAHVGGDPPSIEEEMAAHDRRPAGRQAGADQPGGKGSGSPMDL